jgi:hypothetical protein
MIQFSDLNHKVLNSIVLCLLINTIIIFPNINDRFVYLYKIS